MQGKNLDEGRQICSQSELLAGDRYSEIDTNRGPKRHAYGVRRGAIKCANAQALLHPAEEQFDLPALPIKLRNRRGFQRPMIGPKGQAHGVLVIEDADAAPQVRPMAGLFGNIQIECLLTSADALGAGVEGGCHTLSN